ncbi:hypothetical protein C8Q69DRAFT_237964 [Paecilomyces variotii]|uniref:Extracellular proline-rich protein n=1 Tax=Byssochlamys spectabilis TaxID=264951 RepID=A0A443HWP1_BYSSP|nr:hypothetical protein C8Q69DRAFT_237964 [Paecilomyces variotii]KAJ9230366.1 hypothetical protein DTO169E5_8483 [Paecilomyces variotii]KAJ9252613.1 hypothetical protein DTO207G8_4675 [Paecilomyces variotii]KAJ9256741.1 hypothetical protein DTO212C5_8989 [Paecilomyces variotii]KAJ9308615.1 hypothetical protein DTO217A2_1857 [Paecilomyces variotii]KAJ9362564.1 hypothetical protein DTO027B9_241 [Paecilomyces variotii]
MKFTSVVAAFGAVNVALAAPAGLAGLRDLVPGLPAGLPAGLPNGLPAGLPSGLPTGLPTPPSGALPFPTGAIPSGIPTPSGLPSDLPGESEGNAIVRRGLFPKPPKGPFPEHHHHRPQPTGTVPLPTGGFPTPTGGLPFLKDDVPVTNFSA